MFDLHWYPFTSYKFVLREDSGQRERKEEGEKEEDVEEICGV